jgi:cell wall-associated NlpC family hydrolase
MSVTPDTEKAPEETFDPGKIKQAGEGTVEVENPFGRWYELPDIDEPTYTEIKSKAETKATGSGTADKLIALAKKYVGTPYKWGGNGPLGFDCSGFTQYVFKQFGINLPRVSYQQANLGPRKSIKEARPGDLIAWDNSTRNNGADHIGIYLGNGLVIHAPKPGDAVKISKVWGNPWAVSMNL